MRPSASRSESITSGGLLHSRAGESADLIVRLSLLLLLVYPPGAWYARIPLALIAVIGIVWPRWSHHWAFWASATGFVALANGLGWYAADNHKYLLAYWCLTLTCAFLAREPLAVLSVSARWLVGLVFALSVAWKLAAGDFVDGSFFEYTLLMDPRFEPISRLLCGYSEGMAQFNQLARKALVSWDSSLSTVQLVGAHQVRFLAAVLAVWTLVVEGLIAVLFLVPRTRLGSALANALLIAFSASTYLIAHVVGFGSTLAVLGAAYASTQSRWWLRAHVALFIVMQIYRLPWWGIAQNAAATVGG